MRIVRGAVSVEKNDKEEIKQKVIKLFEEMVKKNDLKKQEILGIIFTMTKDLNKIFPSKVLRENFDLSEIPFLDLEHKDIEGALEKCIRVMIFVNTNRALIPIYLDKAENLRKDLYGGWSGFNFKKRN